MARTTKNTKKAPAPTAPAPEAHLDPGQLADMDDTTLQQLARDMDDVLARYKDELTPAVILIPGKEGSLGLGMANIKKSVERAVGADIL